MGPTKNKVGYLNNHKGSRDNQDLGQGWTIHLLHKATLQDLERLLFILMHPNHHRDSQKTKKQRRMFQTKEQDKTSGK